MADIKDKEYSQLREDLEMLGKGAEKHKKDAVHPLPPNITKTRYTESAGQLMEAFNAVQEAMSLYIRYSSSYII